MGHSASEEHHICKTCRKILSPDECFSHAERTGHVEFLLYFSEESTDEERND